MRTRTARRLATVCALGAMGAMLLSSPAPGAEIRPSTYADENGGGTDCSLREAIIAANTDAAFGGCAAGDGADTVPIAAGTYGLSIPLGTTTDDELEGDLDVTDRLTIAHAGLMPAVIDGGGIDRVIHVRSDGNLIASGVTIRNGRSTGYGAGIRNVGTLDLANATVTGNESTASFGGGIANVATATMTLTNVTVSGNRAENDGGGIDQGFGGVSNLNNVTVTGNIADTDGDDGAGGGIRNAEPETILDPEGTVNLRNTIVAGNGDDSPALKSPDCGGTVVSRGNNLIGDLTGCAYTAAGGDKLNVNPLLGPLANNGGSTFTHALMPGSPALDGAGPGAAPIDQRGVSRTSPDIGAYEFATCAGKIVNRVGTGGADKLVGTRRADGILALAGRDRVSGLGGKDGLCGGAGKDVLEGGRAKDRLVGGPGRDVLIGGKGRDRCKGGAGRDVEKNC